VFSDKYLNRILNMGLPADFEFEVMPRKSLGSSAEKEGK
jgi:hypothetical protein